MKYLLEILKILDGSVNADQGKVAAYTEQLAGKLERTGDKKAAASIRRTLSQGRTHHLKTARTSPAASLPVDSESRLKLADEEFFAHDANVEVFLETDVESTVEEFLKYVGAADRLIAQGVGITPSLLAHGPPGCGKTELGRHIAARLGLPLLTARTDGLISSYLGSTAKNLRLLFEHAMARPCVLFLDEFDAIAKLRDDRHELGELKRVVVSLLQNMDALDNQTVLLAATNHEHLLDLAIWRRFGYCVRIERPGPNVRNLLFHKFLGEFASEKQFEVFVGASHGLTGADIRQTAEDAKRMAIVEGRECVNEADLLRRLIRVRSPELLARDANPAQTLRVLRDLDKNVFTFRRLSAMLGLSTGHISNLLREKE